MELKNDRAVVFRYLANCDAMAEISTGWIDPNGIIRNDYVVVKKAPSRVVTEIVEKFTMVSLTSDGLLIPLDN
jgi:hypothetical protein